MVRKRTRKYESDDDNDTDSDLDFDFNGTSHQPAPKKYSLRERKRTPMFTNDFDYYGLDEDEDVKKSSDDDDFQANADNSSSKGCYESDSGPQNSEGLIDFEDIIRADIVVNKNKIDYDNIIQKTEIKLTEPKRRGRKPKNYVPPSEQSKTEVAEQNHTNENDVNNLQLLAHLENKDNEEDSHLLQPEINFCEGQDILPNSDTLENGSLDKLVDEIDPLAIKNTKNIETVIQPVVQENILKEDEAKSFEDEDDDVIVLGELKQDVIVLDD